MNRKARTLLAATAVNLIWKSPGPVSSAYKACAAPMCAIMGPIGGGKTTTTFHKKLDIARAIPPSRDGIARAKFPVIRDTIRNLNRTTLRTWQRIVPASVGRFVGASGSEPGFHEFRLWPEVLKSEAHEPSEIFRRLDMPGAVERQGRICRPVDVRMEFFAVGENDVEALMRGIEGTSGFVNEGDLAPEELFAYLPDRLMRYPERDSVNRDALDRAFGYGQVNTDFNAPAPDNHLYKACFETKPKGLEVFVQPGGRAPDAENLENLSKTYYAEKIGARPPYYIRRMIDNQPCFGRAGSVVFTNYVDQKHCARENLKPIPGLPILVGMDAAYNPAVTIWQRTPTQWRGLDELFGLHVGPHEFGARLNALLTRRFAGYEILGACDPTAKYGEPDRPETAFAAILERITHVKFKGAHTNAWAPRFEAMHQPMGRADGDVQHFQIGPNMIQSRAALNGRYFFEKKKGSDTQEDERPQKSHPWSDLMDSGQAVFLVFGDRAQIEGREQRRASAGGGRVIQARTSFNVFGSGARH